MNDTRHLGKLFEVLKLDENGNPRDPGDPMDVDLREMPVPTLIAFQGRLTAEFARRLSGAQRPSWLPATATALQEGFPATEPTLSSDEDRQEG